jgi:hypothetical protein
MKQRALRMLRKLQDGVTRDIGELGRGLVQANRHNLRGKFFDRYFMTNAIPENALRFHAVQERLEARLSTLRRTGRYGI